ncbi:zinc finger MYM-type protein 1-like [Pseudophryne corroboree]|uniref:zinc finger MYM-type protein 1-like n=1 Tax=Pseudophryne corroboree TaxID=495146 RepID=UPI0030816633
MSKKPSGAEYRKKAKEREQAAQRSSSLMSSWLSDKSSNKGEMEKSCDLEADKTQEKIRDQQEDISSSTISTDIHNQDTISGTSAGTQGVSCMDFAFDFNDPGTWPSRISDPERCFITRMRAGTQHNPDLSRSLRDGRHLTKEWFFKQLPNGQKVNRSWLGYSQTKNALFCIPCRLFSQASSETTLPYLAKEEGLTQWRKLSDKIPDHENSLHHKSRFCNWKTLETSLGIGGIDRELQLQIAKEEKHWRVVLHCIIDAIMFLAKQGSPLRGSQKSSDFGNPNSGKFLNTIDLISHYHAPLREHIERHKKGQVTYFSSAIQDEFLKIIAGKVRQDILNEIKEARYFALMFDCTPDVSKLEQMTEVIRYVKVSENGPEIVESFIDFFVVSDKTGLGLSEEILKKVQNDGLDMKFCRGQSYDNGANMAGVYKGVQARILQENELAYFVPCAAHSLNLVGVHAADISPEAQTFFGTLHSLYLYFAASTSRWEILKKHVPTSLRSQSKTRWSAKMEAVEAVYKHLDKVMKALEELGTNPLSSPETKSEANSLLKHISKFEFIIITCFWYGILRKIDRVSQYLQRDDVTVDKAVRNIRGLINLIQSARESAVPEAITEAKDIAHTNNLTTDFKETRSRKKKRMFDESETPGDDASNISQEKLFRISLLEIIDRIISELNKRFLALEKINEKFGFLHGMELQKSETKHLKTQAKELAQIYKEDINEEEFLHEIESFKFHALEVDEKMKSSPPATILTLIYKHRLEEAYPNITTALQIFLTLPVSVASRERSFSKLKLIKTYLRNTMGQERLTNLSIISIEHKRASTLCYEDIIKIFAAKKARRVQL